jgi:hypothetical protein
VSIDALQKRARQLRARVAVRAWEYRQRHHAKGVWLRLRRLLASAKEAYVITEDEAARLVEEGVRPEAVGRELEPPRAIFVVSAERAREMTGRKEIAVTLGPELLAAERLVLVPF